MWENKKKHAAALSALFLLIPWLLLSQAVPVSAAEADGAGQAGGEIARDENGLSYQNPDTGYSAFLYDYAELLSEEEELSLMQESIIPITGYGHAMFVSDSTADGAVPYAADMSYQTFGDESNLVFVIDMGARDLAIATKGAVEKRLNQNYTLLITDNVYSYASRQDYYGCVQEAFYEAYTLLSGGHIATPMRHITNLLLAVVLGLLINFIYVWIKKRKIAVKEGEVLALGTGAVVAGAAIGRTLIKSHRSRVSSSSSSGGGGGGGGGGGFSGSVGGHRF